MEYLWLLLPATLIGVALIMRALANNTANLFLNRLSKRLGTEWNDETYYTLRLHFRAEARAQSLALVAVIVAATLVAIAVSWVMPALSAVYVGLGVAVVGLVATTAVFYTRQAAARGASRGVPARLRDVVHPLVLATLITGFTLCVLAIVLYLFLVPSDATSGAPIWGVEYAAIGAATCVAVGVCVRLLPRHAVGLEYVYRFRAVTTMVGLGLVQPMLGAVYGLMSLSDRVEWLSASGPFVVLAVPYFGLVLVAAIFVDYRPYRVPEHSIQLLGDSPPVRADA
jgi:hypothetical protein